MTPTAHPHFTCDESLPLGEALKGYFDLNKFGPDGGYHDRWVEVKLGPITFTIPNTQSRVRAVRIHDLHHIVTEYQTTLKGESEIAAWEVATGCRDMYTAWNLNLSAFGFGALVWSGPVWRAFLRGRRSRNYYGAEYGPELLSRTVGAARTELGLGPDGAAARSDRASARDVLAFAGFVGAALPLLFVNSVAWLALTPFALLTNAILKPRREAAQQTP